MNALLTIIRWTFTLPVWGIEYVVKVISMILLSLGIFLMTIFYPFFKYELRHIKETRIYKYSYKFKGNYPLTKKVFKTWCD